MPSISQCVLSASIMAYFIRLHLSIQKVIPLSNVEKLSRYPNVTHKAGKIRPRSITYTLSHFYPKTTKGHLEPLRAHLEPPKAPLYNNPMHRGQLGLRKLLKARIKLNRGHHLVGQQTAF